MADVQRLRLGELKAGVMHTPGHSPGQVCVYFPSDSMLMGDKCGAHTFPYIEVRNPTAKCEHEASTSKISEDQLFYCNQRGIATEDAVSMLVHGFCKEVLNELPMEFAVEARRLLEVSLEGSVG